MFRATLGREYTEHEIEMVLQEQVGVRYRKVDDICGETAKLLIEGKIVGWFQGRSEFGPRALGNRSILVDPRNPAMKDTLNKRVKFRENFRPFAPAVLWEKQTKYFDLDITNPYMLVVRDVHPDKRDVIPSVTHVDGTGRIQTVTKEFNPRFYQLITEFEKLTDVPVVLNTSFNVKGEPIVESPADAVRCFLGTQIDHLAIGNYLVDKE